MLAMVAESALRSLLLGGAVWVGLQLFRVKNPHVQITCWTVVLVASLAMPLLMHWTTVTITLAPSISDAPAHLWPSTTPDALTPDAPPVSLPASPALPAAAAPAAFPWLMTATMIYAVIAGFLLLRLLLGLYLTSRLVRRAVPLRVVWAGNADVRVSPAVSGPVTFGATILLPPDYRDWDMAKRQAVLAHESAHVANRDFYLLLLASLNNALFWFSPFAWWQSWRLAELAEMISDARALEIVDDRLSYAQILLDLVQHGR